MTTIKPQDPTWIEHASIQIEHTASITATPSQLWNVLADNQTWPDWFPGFTQCAFTSEAPHGVGSIRELQQDRFRVSEKITIWEPNKAWAMTVTQISPGLLRCMAETVYLHETETGVTEVEWRIGVDTHWWVKRLFSTK